MYKNNLEFARPVILRDFLPVEKHLFESRKRKRILASRHTFLGEISKRIAGLPKGY